jgi:AraC family transcriptional regulator
MVLASAPGAVHRLDDIAASLGVSPSHLAHVFRAQVGIPMHQYLLQVRMGIALHHLSEGAANLSQLALDLGFVSHSHFTAAFRHFFGVTPRVARQSLALTA